MPERLKDHIPLATPCVPHSRGVTLYTQSTIAEIINNDGTVNFDFLLNLLQHETYQSVREFFERKEHIELILFPFFDYLSSTYFLQGNNIPSSITAHLRSHPSIQNSIPIYVEKRNHQIQLFQHTESYSTIAFHLFLLWLDEKVDLIIDAQVHNFQEVWNFFRQKIEEVSLHLNDVSSQESLINKLYYCLQIGETLNRLALMHSVNIDYHWMSWALSILIQENIDILILQLGENNYNASIWKKLRNLSGKMCCNFSYGEPVNWGTIDEIYEQNANIKDEMVRNFNTMKSVDFWLSKNNWDPSEHKGKTFKEILTETEKLFTAVVHGNTVNRWLQTLRYITSRYGKDALSTEQQQEWKDLMDSMIGIYNNSTEHHFTSTQEVIDDFRKDKAQNDFQIEALYSIVHYTNELSDKLMRDLIEHFLQEKQSYNPFYEEYSIKILTSLIRRITKIDASKLYASAMENIFSFIAQRNISHSTLSYAKVYLALGLYYIKYEDRAAIKAAQVCFLHYKDLNNGNKYNTQDEEYFYKKLGRKGVNPEDLGRYLFEIFQENYPIYVIQSISHSVQEEIARMSGNRDSYDQTGDVNYMIGKEISKKLFYNLCIIEITGDCWITTQKRGFKVKKIPLEENKYISFTYPSISETIFLNIFQKYKAYITRNFKSLIDINDSNFQIQHNPDTWVFNHGKLDSDILDGKSNTIVLMSISGYESMATTLHGTTKWGTMMKAIAIYLQQESQATVYQYNTDTFCLVYKLKDNRQISEQELMELIQKLINHFHDIYDGQNKFHAGITLWQTTNHLIYTYIALRKAITSQKWSDKGFPIYVFKTGDEEEGVEIATNRKLLNIALEWKDPNIQLVPYYQRIYNPKDPNKKKYEALVRIEHRHDGIMEIITPDKFMPIAEHDKTVSKITVRMMNQIIVDMKQNEDMDVSINFWQQDWYDNTNINLLKTLCTENNIDTQRICIEVLETSQFSGKAGQERIQQVKTYWFKISLDDYGTEHGNLEKLALLRPDFIKLDRCLIEKLNISDAVRKLKLELLQPNISKIDRETIQAQINDLYSKKEFASHIIESTTRLAKKINAVIIAEYVENEEIFHDLQKLWVKNFQGYYFTKPLPFNKLNQPPKNIPNSSNFWSLYRKGKGFLNSLLTRK